MDYNDDIKFLADNLRWNLCNKKALCAVGITTVNPAVETLLRLLSIEMDNVKREAVNLVHELYDNTEIFAGVDFLDDDDVIIRERLCDFLTMED